MYTKKLMMDEEIERLRGLVKDNGLKLYNDVCSEEPYCKTWGASRKSDCSKTAEASV